ncbi:hypothetical protein D4764_0132380 [Takifugu flavidus]|uniref:Uncharacterized protein n=1 Tax=Takifugu flavidus TaxID=433684 RepID=A0A5C6MN99_9TELE|nr:hypothetical protein D4764_0132380 [Takifugu flavidus]
MQQLLKSTDVSTGSFDFHRDPPAQCHGAQTDPPVPALRFCGQLAQWTGNSTNYQVRAAHATLVGFCLCGRGTWGSTPTIFFEASPGEVASSRLELRNEGNTSIFYSWQQLDVSSSLSHLLSHRSAAASTSTSPQDGRAPAPPGDKAGKTVTEKFCRSMVYKILEGVQTRERSSSLVEFLMGSPEEERERQEVGNGRADQSLGRDFAHDQTFTDFTPFEEEAYSAAFGSFSGSTSPM